MCEQNLSLFREFIHAICEHDLEYIQSHAQSIYGFNAIKRPGMTLLAMAVDLIDEEIVDFLMRHGADINVQCYDGATPLHVAIASVQDLYQIALQENNYSDKIEPDLKIIKKVLSYHPNLDIKKDYGKRAEDVFPGWKELHDLIDAERQWQIDNNYQHKIAGDCEG